MRPEKKVKEFVENIENTYPNFKTGYNSYMDDSKNNSRTSQPQAKDNFSPQDRLDKRFGKPIQSKEELSEAARKMPHRPIHKD